MSSESSLVSVPLAIVVCLAFAVGMPMNVLMSTCVVVLAFTGSFVPPYPGSDCSLLFLSVLARAELGLM